jgi:uncharacterized protein YuzE
MKIHIDKANDALYLRLDDSAIIESEEVSPGVMLDYNAEGMVTGLEILKLSSRTASNSLDCIQLLTA